ncbi:unnamed protein product [Rotaria magnacalcarata]|uniref:Uncharacterized protein n=1 Tax=Rotaria magnacalcarata TaxID=392030 RepID=A0A816ZCT4_9BILA|nr:unnamed protein product [Rotaria magnacalcarata]CAF3916623.1 unnamed protein product [Rotaria magnacalcarata]
MLNLYRYLKSINKNIIKSNRYLSISKSDLIESSRKIQELLKSTDDKSSSCKWLYNSLNKIHEEYSSTTVATSTKEVYEKNSSKFNSTFLELENDRKQQIGNFNEKDQEQLIILLRYIRYLQVAFTYRLITFDVDISLKESSTSIIHLTKNQNYLKQNSLSLLCELTFFVYFLSSQHSLSHVKKLLKETSIIYYLLTNLFSILSDKRSIELVNQLCLTLHSIVEIPSSSTIDLWPHIILEYLYNKKSCSSSIIEYLILIKHSSTSKTPTKLISLLNEYLIEIGIHQNNSNIICQLLILISSFNYSHELFIREIHEKIKSLLKKSKNNFNPLSDIKLCSRLIYYLCLTDPTNRFESRSIIVELSRKISENIEKNNKFSQWIVQAQHGMMLSNIYNYQLLFSTVQHQLFPFLFRDLGVYTWSIPRQLSDIHHALIVDRPSLETPLLNSEMLAFATKISEEYRLSIRKNQKAYNKFLTELKDLFNNIYGNGTCQIIDTNQNYPNILFDFLEINLPDNEQFKSIGINTQQRIAVLPILNSMLIKQQRSDGSLVRVLSAQTTMRYRIIEKRNYQILLIFHGEYLRALRDNTIKTIFETNLALKTLPHVSIQDT